MLFLFGTPTSVRTLMLLNLFRDLFTKLMCLNGKVLITMIWLLCWICPLRLYYCVAVVEEVHKLDTHTSASHTTVAHAMSSGSSATASAKSQSKQTLNQTVSSSHCASAGDLKKQQLDVNSCAACGNKPADQSLRKCACKMVAYCDKNCQRQLPPESFLLSS